MSGERLLEKEYQEKLTDFQEKMEVALREREAQVREELEAKNKQMKHRHHQELQKVHEMLKQRENEIDNLMRQNVELAQEKQQLEASLQKAELEFTEF